MHVIRPVSMDDLDQLMALTEWVTFGLTTLPKDRALLRRRIRESERAFEKTADERPGSDPYLFVLEDTAAGRIAGTTGVVAKIGGFEPFYAYRIETSVHESKMLGVRKEIDVLHLHEQHSGPSEIGSLFLHPDYRGGGVGRALSLSRFLFIAEQPSFFDVEVIAELRGVIDEAGRTPFWDALGRHFFDIEFAKADALSVVNKEFIGDLMPRHPIYIPVLPAAAQEVIGRVHEETKPARRLLESEGFGFAGLVDIFEAGPVLRCNRVDIRTVRDSERAVVGDVTDHPPEGAQRVIGNTERLFRACQGRLAKRDDGKVTLSRDVAEALRVEPGDAIRHATLKPEGG